MFYQVSVDGRKKQIEVNLKGNSRRADNAARKAVIDHYLDVNGACSVIIESSFESAAQKSGS